MPAKELIDKSRHKTTTANVATTMLICCITMTSTCEDRDNQGSQTVDGTYYYTTILSICIPCKECLHATELCAEHIGYHPRYYLLIYRRIVMWMIPIRKTTTANVATTS